MTALGFLFSFNGTATRFAALCAVLCALIAQVGMGVLAELAPMQARYFFPILALAAVVLLTVSARRLHHAGQSGRWAVFTLVPLLGLVAGFIIAMLPQRRVRLWANNGARLLGYGLIGLILLLGIWRVWWVPFSVVSESMKPALLVGDYVLARAGAPLSRGDVVLMHRASDGAQVVKRVIGLGGDTVALKGGQVWLNGAALVQLPQGEFTEIMAPQGPLGNRPRCENGLVGDGAICRKSLLREVLPDGRSISVLNIEAGGVGDEMAEVPVPQGMLFLLGDNRDNSLDSRFDIGVGGLGMVSETEVLAVARRVVISSQGPAMLTPWTWRLGRMWRTVDE